MADKNLAEDVTQKANTAIQLANKFTSITIADEDQYQTAACDLKGIKLKSRELEDLRLSMTRPIDESKKKIIAFFAKPITALAAAETAIKDAMLVYQGEQEKLRIAEENRLREQQRQAEEKLRQEAEASRAEEAALNNQAMAALAAGKSDMAESLIQKAETVGRQVDATEQRADFLAAAVPIVESTITKASGVSTRAVWQYKIVDAEKIPREFLMVDEKKLGAYARAMKDAAKVDGVVFFLKPIIAA